MDDTPTVDAAGRPVAQNWANYYSLYSNKRNRIQANIAQRLGDLGSVYLNGSRQTFWDDTSTTTSLQAGFSSTFGRVNYSVSYGYSHGSGQHQTERSFYLSLSLPLSGWGTTDSAMTPGSSWATYSMNQDSKGPLCNRPGSTAQRWQTTI